MFKPFGKYPKDYLKTDSAKAFIAALEADGTNILSGTELVQVIKGVSLSPISILRGQEHKID